MGVLCDIWWWVEKNEDCFGFWATFFYRLKKEKMSFNSYFPNYFSIEDILITQSRVQSKQNVNLPNTPVDENTSKAEKAVSFWFDELVCGGCCISVIVQHHLSFLWRYLWSEGKTTWLYSPVILRNVIKHFVVGKLLRLSKLSLSTARYSMSNQCTIAILLLPSSCRKPETSWKTRILD